MAILSTQKCCVYALPAESVITQVHTLLRYIRVVNAGASLLEGAVSSACFLFHFAVSLTI